MTSLATYLLSRLLSFGKWRDTIGVHLIAKSTDKYDPETFMIYNNVVLCIDKNTRTLMFLYEILYNLKERSKYYYLCCGK